MSLFAQFFDKTKLGLNILSFGEIVAGKKRIDYDSLIGKKYNKWTILSYFSGKSCIIISCRCECGTLSNIQSNAVLRGRSKSCKYCAPKKHGCYKSPTNSSWSAARNRCNNKNNKYYESYGGRGIKMCQRWDRFENFLADMGEKPDKMTLDRINNDGDYEPSNCRWATYSQQNSNQRKKKRRVNNGLVSSVGTFVL